MRIAMSSITFPEGRNKAASRAPNMGAVELSTAPIDAGMCRGAKT
jgi:hypothetical protein